MDGAVPVQEKHIPVFSSQAKIYTVDTLEGLICTHEVIAKDVYIGVWQLQR